MHVVIKTSSGSMYEIHDWEKTWKRLTIGDDKYTTRTSEGEFISRSEIEVGKSFTMLGNGLVAGTRLISTTPVTEIINIL